MGHHENHDDGRYVNPVHVRLDAALALDLFSRPTGDLSRLLGADALIEASRLVEVFKHSELVERLREMDTHLERVRREEELRKSTVISLP